MSRITTYPRLVFGTRYPAIPHLHGSASSEGDVVLSAQQTAEVLRRPIVAFEKLDGLNVGFSFKRGVPVVHSRVHGVVPLSKLGPSLWPLVDFVFEHLGALRSLLGDGLRLCGEWLEGVPSRLPYPRRAVPFVGFDLMDLEARTFLEPRRAHALIANAGFPVPQPVLRGRANLEALWALTRRSRFGGPAEGLVIVQGPRCFKLVREDYLARPVRVASAPPPAPLPARAPRSRRLVKKVFEPGDERRDVEVDRLSVVGALGPRLVRVDGQTVVMERLPGRPRAKPLGPNEARALGRSLAALHRCETKRVLEALEPRPSLQLWRACEALKEQADDVSRRWLAAMEQVLVPLLRSLERGLPSPRVVCHGDLKPQHVFFDPAGAVRFLDFESALVADPAWELGAVFERLALDARARVAMARSFASDDGTAMLRAWLYRLAWQFIQPAVRRHERMDEETERILQRSAASAKVWLEQWTESRLPSLR